MKIPLIAAALTGALTIYVYSEQAEQAQAIDSYAILAADGLSLMASATQALDYNDRPTNQPLSESLLVQDGIDLMASNTQPLASQ